MEEAGTILEKLDGKVTQLLQNYRNAQEEMETLRSELVSLKAHNEMQSQEIKKLTDENVQKDREIESIVNKIESILS
jgi:cell division protein FtsB